MSQLHSLQEAFERVRLFCETHKTPQELCFKLNLVCEELVVNLFKYSKATAYDLDLSETNAEVRVQVRYKGIEFDPIKTTAPEQNSVEEMEYGGLGLVLVNALASDIQYRYDHKNALNVIKVTISY